MSAELAVCRWLRSTGRKKTTKADVETKCVLWWIEKGRCFQPSTLTRAFQRLIEPGGNMGKVRWESEGGRRVYTFPKISKRQLDEFTPVAH